MPHATFVKKRLGRPDGIAAVFRLSEPIKYKNKTTEYVWVSAVPYVGSFEGPETYIFPSDAEGEVLDWLELDGSFRGEMNIEKALAGLGFPVLGAEVSALSNARGGK